MDICGIICGNALGIFILGISLTITTKCADTATHTQRADTHTHKKQTDIQTDRRQTYRHTHTHTHIHTLTHTHGAVFESIPINPVQNPKKVP